MQTPARISLPRIEWLVDEWIGVVVGAITWSRGGSSVLSTIGLILAILDFTGLSEKLECLIDQARDALARRIKEGDGIWPYYLNVALFGPKAINKMLTEFEWSNQFAAPNLAVGLTRVECCFLIIYFVMIPWAIYEHEFETIFKLIAIPLAIYVAMSVAGLILTALAGGIFMACYYLLHLLNMPSKGTVGTIGLLIAVGDWVLGRFY
jgi:hypothetical protein